jgi:hypothetical protein
MEAATITGSRAEKARITVSFVFRRMCSVATRWMAMRYMQVSVMISREAMACHLGHCAMVSFLWRLSMGWKVLCFYIALHPCCSTGLDCMVLRSRR